MIRPTTTNDLPALKAVIDTNQLFPSDMLDAMLAPYWSGEAGDERWLTDDDNEPIAVAYYVPQRMTDGTWNLLLIAVHSPRSRTGAGCRTAQPCRTGAGGPRRTLLVSGNIGVAKLCAHIGILPNQGYVEEARIRGFYQAGEDKVVYRRPLGAQQQ